MTSPLSTNALLALIPHLLPLSSSSSTTSSLALPTDIIAALVHAIHTSLHFRLTNQAQASSEGTAAVEEPEPEGDNNDDNDDTVSETATAVDDEPAGQASSSQNLAVSQEVIAGARLPSGWNSRGEDSYTFEYKHEQSGLKFIVRVGRMGGRVNVSGMAEDGEPHQSSILLNELVNSSFTPWPRADDPSSRNQGLSGAFISDQKLKDFIEKYKKEIIAKLIPGLSVNGVTIAGPEPEGRGGPRPDQPRGGAFPPPHPQPQHPAPPNQPYNPSIGHRDLDPLASYRPPGRGGPDPLRDIDRDGGGMMVDFNHPLFRGRRDEDDEAMGMRGPGGMINPPGARWDPVGPGFGGGGRGGGGGGGGIGGGPGGIGGGGLRDPDFDEMLPPGEFGPDLRQPGGRGGIGGPRGGPGGFGGGMGGPGFGGGFGGGGRAGGGGGFGGFGGGGGGMYM